MVAFTFDDGPDYWTRFILDVIDGTEDKLTFFVTYQAKSWLDGTIYEDSLRRAHSLGCEIGIHSKNHAYVYTASTGTDASAEVLQTELYDFAEIIAGITGEKPKIFRPVGGSFNTQKDYGYPAILWSVDSKDWIISAKYWDEGLKNHQIQDRNEEVRKVVEKATKELVDNVVSTVKSGDIVLMHDVHFLSKNAFPEIYRQLKEQGYRFVTVSELLNIDPTEQNGCYFFSTSEYGKDGMLYRLTDTGIVSEQFAVKPTKVY